MAGRPPGRPVHGRPGRRAGEPDRPADRDDPGHWLGASGWPSGSAAALPFLLKVLPPPHRCRLQAHPDASRPRAGYAAEAGAVRDGGSATTPIRTTSRSCWSRSTPFEALCGFRDPAESADGAGRFGVPELAPVVAALRGRAGGGCATAVRTLLSWPAERPRPGWSARGGGVGRGRTRRWPRELAEPLPGRPGRAGGAAAQPRPAGPGEAIWMPAGNLHAYLRGVRRGDHGGQRQRAARRADPEAGGRRRAAAGAALRGARRSGDAAGRRWRPGVVTWPVPVRRLRAAPGAARRRPAPVAAAAARAPDRALRAGRGRGRTTASAR